MEKNNDKSSGSDGETLFRFFNEIGIISQLTSRMMEVRLTDEMTMPQFSVLNWFIRVDTQATPGRLARAFQVTGGAMTNTLRRLQNKGFIKVEPDATSGRQKRVTITAAGKRARLRSLKAIAPLLDEFAQSLPADNILTQLNELQQVRKYLDEYRFRD